MGYIGADRTLDLVRTRFFLPKMASDIEKKVKPVADVCAVSIAKESGTVSQTLKPDTDHWNEGYPCHHGSLYKVCGRHSNAQPEGPNCGKVSVGQFHCTIRVPSKTSQ